MKLGIVGGPGHGVAYASAVVTAVARMMMVLNHHVPKKKLQMI